MGRGGQKCDGEFPRRRRRRCIDLVHDKPPRSTVQRSRRTSILRCDAQLRLPVRWDVEAPSLGNITIPHAERWKGEAARRLSDDALVRRHSSQLYHLSHPSHSPVTASHTCSTRGTRRVSEYRGISGSLVERRERWRTELVCVPPGVNVHGVASMPWRTGVCAPCPAFTVQSPCSSRLCRHCCDNDGGCETLTGDKSQLSHGYLRRWCRVRRAAPSPRQRARCRALSHFSWSNARMVWEPFGALGGQRRTSIRFCWTDWRFQTQGQTPAPLPNANRHIVS